MDTVPICVAVSKQSNQRCKNFSVKDKKVCHIHGGKSTGAKTNAGKIRQKMTRLKHGLRSKDTKAKSKQLREFIKACKEVIQG